MKYIIIGNGIAGIHAADSIRRFDDKGSIIMISDENCAPYSRPMISMVLEGSISPQKIYIHPNSFYEKNRITTFFGERVTNLNIDEKCIIVGNNKIFSYDTLLIASGADPRPIHVKGIELDNIFYMRTETHVKKMISVLPNSKNALVLGGGLVGFKAAYALLRRGLNVTMLIRSPYPLSMQVDDTAGHMILNELINHGLTVKTMTEVTAFEGKDRVQKAYLSNGSELPCDLVVIGKGVLPSMSYIPKASIHTDSGVLVNNHMETNVSGIYAAGDVAESYDIVRQSKWVNAIWPEAVSQGRIAGMNMAGKSVSYKGSLGRNVIRLFDMDVMTAGIVNPDDDRYQVISDFNAKKNTYRKFVFYHNVLRGYVLINSIVQGGIFHTLISNQIQIKQSKDIFLSNQFNFGNLLTQRVC